VSANCSQRDRMSPILIDTLAWRLCVKTQIHRTMTSGRRSATSLDARTLWSTWSKVLQWRQQRAKRANIRKIAAKRHSAVTVPKKTIWSIVRVGLYSVSVCSSNRRTRSFRHQNGSYHDHVTSYLFIVCQQEQLFCLPQRWRLLLFVALFQVREMKILAKIWIHAFAWVFFINTD